MTTGDDDVMYHAVIVDSGPVIRQAMNLFRSTPARHYVTTPGVLQELRDAKTRRHLQSGVLGLVLDKLEVREPSSEAMQAVIAFSKQTGDFASLSHVDLQVLALTYDLEKEGCLSVNHVRTTPKRTVGLGTIQLLNAKQTVSSTPRPLDIDYDVVQDEDEEESAPDDVAASDDTDRENMTETAAPRSWAALVNPDDATTETPDSKQTVDLETELQSEFPSLQAAATVPYREDDIAADASDTDTPNVTEKYQRSQEEKQKNLQPVTKSGKLYNSFRKYGDLMKPASLKPKTHKETMEIKPTLPTETPSSIEPSNPKQSKIIGSSAMIATETMKHDEDDGEGWITSAADIQTIKVNHGGMLDPTKGMSKAGKAVDVADANITTNPNAGPSLSQRAACATTDFAMQNVLLQMNLILLSVDGMRIRRLKSWVIRCGACFKIHSAADDDGFLDGRIRRLFCSHCGSGDMMQRISASVDGKTGRLKLHFSKRKQGKHMSKRGTKFSLPKPGTGNRFQGDLLLREDQLLVGAWNQKVKIRSGNAYQKSNSESIFGRDLAATVGCNVTKSGGNGSFGSSSWATGSNPSSSSSAHDIRVGFGARKNPNAAKGRERRGKKKKSSDRACGMRRY